MLTTLKLPCIITTSDENFAAQFEKVVNDHRTIGSPCVNATEIGLQGSERVVLLSIRGIHVSEFDVNKMLDESEIVLDKDWRAK